MLDQLRKHSRGLFAKIIFSLLVVGLVSFFGYSTFNRTPQSQNGQSSSAPAAWVDGQPIPSQAVEWNFQRQKEFYQQAFKNGIPEEILKSLKQEALESLIRTNLFAGQIQSLGLAISDQELAKKIVSIHGGKGFFDQKEYLKRIQSHRLATGEDYEASVRKQMMADKVKDLVEQSIRLSEAKVRQNYLLEHTQVNLQKVTLDLKKANLLPESLSESDKAQTQPETASSQAARLQEIKDEISSALTQNEPALESDSQPRTRQKDKKPSVLSPLDALKDRYSLTIVETGLIPLYNKTLVAGSGANQDELYSCVVKLKPENPVCPPSQTSEQTITFVKLLQRQEADLSKWEEQKQANKTDLEKRYQNLILREIGEKLQERSSIHIVSE